MITNFRRTMIGNMPKLYYLDERPVQEIERAGIEAFKIGGKEAEMKARDEIAQKVHFANTGGHSVKRLTQQLDEAKVARKAAFKKMLADVHDEKTDLVN